MEKYRVTAVNGRAWITDTLEHRDAIGALAGAHEDVLEFTGTPVGEDSGRTVRVAIACRHIASIEEWPN